MRFVLNKYFHCGQSAVFTGANPDEEAQFTNQVALTLQNAFSVRIHPMQIVVCGSAHLGFSPVPDKLGTSFDPLKSDVDVAVISAEIFDLWWGELQGVNLSIFDRGNIARDLFWGFINPANARVSAYGHQWWAAFGGLRTDRAAGVRGRLYRTFWSMQNYHRLAVVNARAKLLPVQKLGGNTSSQSAEVAVL